MALPATDTFTEASATALKSHTADSGHAWGNVDRGFTVGAGTGLVKMSGHNEQAIIASPASADYWAEVVGRTGGTATSDRYGVLVRYDGGAHDASNGYLFRVYGNGTWWLHELNGDATPVEIANGAIGSFSASTDYTLRLQATGSTIEAFVNGSSVHSATNSVNSTADNPGIYMRNANASITSFGTSSPPATGGPRNPFGHALKGPFGGPLG